MEGDKYRAFPIKCEACFSLHNSLRHASRYERARVGVKGANHARMNPTLMDLNPAYLGLLKVVEEGDVCFVNGDVFRMIRSINRKKLSNVADASRGLVGSVLVSMKRVHLNKLGIFATKNGLRMLGIGSISRAQMLTCCFRR